MPQRLESFTACDIGTQMVSCYLPPATAFQGTQTAEREDFDLNNTAYDTNIPEVTLCIMVKYLTGSGKSLGILPLRR